MLLSSVGESLGLSCLGEITLPAGRRSWRQGQDTQGQAGYERATGGREEGVGAVSDKQNIGEVEAPSASPSILLH